ncbi:MAG: HpcH/HpaI aldolase family protein [Christensenellales bacterium]|jgi:4-hydroxy-2-oxoheptanedioate aldolase
MLKQDIWEQRVVFGTMISEVATPNVIRIMKVAGFDYVIVDCEHGYFDFSQLANMAAVGNGFGMPVIVRIPFIEREFITKTLDMGADGILVPMVNTADEARKVVEYAKYPPIGKRGVSTTRAHTNYMPPPLSEYMDIANDRTVVLLQIETEQGAQNAEEIASIEGIDALMIGPNDLAVDLGTPSQLDTELMREVIGGVLDSAKKAGKQCGIIGSDIKFLGKWKNEGMTILSHGSEVGMIMKSAKAACHEFSLIK